MMSTQNDGPTLIPVKEMDYLDEDKPIRGQNFVCMSFLSPEDVLKNKETYYFSRFLGQFAKDMTGLISTLKAKYPDDAGLFQTITENNNYIFDSDALQEQYKFFKETNNEEIEREFHAKNNFRTTIRGFKVRGVYDTMDEAKIRAEVLKRMGDKFDIFIAQVGCWCPWSPNPQDLQNQEYAEAQLNTIMKHYKENLTLRDEYYEKRKDERSRNPNAAPEDDLVKEDVWLAKKRDELAKTQDDIPPPSS